MPTDTKEQILDTAERLFAESGIDAVSLRAITAEASVNLAAIHYHFGSKEALVKAVFGRRMIPLNRERVALLTEVEANAGDGQLAVEDVLRTLFAPAIRLSRHPERGETFMCLCGRFYSERGEYMQPMFEELFKEVIARFMAAFRKACPELPVGELFWRTHFAVGAMVHTMCDSDRLRMISQGVCDPLEVEDTIERMVQFTAAGFRAPVMELPAREEEAVAWEGAQ
jgi:AcrR family transcriptional regulator